MLIHPERGDSNIFEHIKIRKGDVAAGFSEADVIVEGRYETPCQEHAYMQPDAGIGYIDEEGRVAVIVATQAPHDDLPHIASVLALEPKDVCLIMPGIGGAFGGREDMHVQHLLALAAYLIRKPVKLVYTRQETTTRTGHRHPFQYALQDRCNQGWYHHCDGNRTDRRWWSVAIVQRVDVEQCSQLFRWTLPYPQCQCGCLCGIYQ